MKMLDLRNDRKDVIVEFDDILSHEGNWEKTKSDSGEWNVVVEIPRGNSSQHRYFLCQDNNNNNVAILRVKKYDID